MSEGKGLVVFQDKSGTLVLDIPRTLSIPDQLTNQFYYWEQRGRGWQVWSDPVVLEPPFQPFFHIVVQQGEIEDDGRIPHPLVSFFQAIGRFFTKPILSPDIVSPVPYAEPIEPLPFQDDDDELVAIQIGLPPNLHTTKRTAERFLLALSYCSYPVSFEVIGTKKK